MRSPPQDDRTRIQPPEQALAFAVLRFDRVEPQREQIHRLLRLQPGHANHRRWFELADELLEALAPLMRPRGVYRIDRVEALEARRLVLASGVVFAAESGRPWPAAAGWSSHYWGGSVLVATFVVTIGSALERLSRGWLRAGKVMPGAIADAIASEAVEATAERLRGQVRLWAQRRGLEVTPTYSPGYCGLSTDQQIPLFAGLPTRAINVRLTPSCLMLPIKSISGLIGIGPPDRVRPDAYPCEACDHPHCVQRRVAAARSYGP